MKRELTPSEIKFDIKVTGNKNLVNSKKISEFEVAYKKVERALKINKSGYNLYLVDSFSKERINELIRFVEEKYKNLEPPKDICYVILEDINRPEAIFVANGKGNKLKDSVTEVKNNYLEAVEEFYGDSNDEEKDFLVDEIQSKRNDYINELMNMAKKEGFGVKATNKGFAFIPLNGDEAMTEKEYDDLEEKKKEIIAEKAGILRKQAEVILDELKDVELSSIKKLKKIYSKFLATKMEEYKDDALLEFITDDDSYEYLERLFTCIEEDLVDCYTMSIEDDENEIYKVLNKYDINVIVDNSKNLTPPVIFEEDPNLNNLVGLIEYENYNGLYTTNISLITAGSIVKANEGCLILRLSSLVNNPSSYYYLKKMLQSNSVSFETNKNYMEYINISSLKPKAIPIKVKVILIGDYESYDILYNSDEDFKKLFPLRAEFPTEIDINDNSINNFINIINEKIRKEELLDLTEEALKEGCKYLCRKCGSKDKILIENDAIDKILVLANGRARENKAMNISKDDIINVVYEKEVLEEEIIESYKKKKILIDVTGKKVGCVNGLAVLDTGYLSFGKPIRITCVAYKGTGRIVDIQKENNLSGKVHEKSISILKGVLSNILDQYSEIPIDFNLCFEQTYGMVDGDSASVAEIISILSAISKRPIKQNIAVTGSINQFGEVQPIGGANEKIEGFFSTCSILDNIKGKGVLIPATNKDEIILKQEVEDAISNGDFHIYIMDTLEDAISTLILEDGESLEDFYNDMKKQVEKYKSKKE